MDGITMAPKTTMNNLGIIFGQSLLTLRFYFSLYTMRIRHELSQKFTMILPGWIIITPYYLVDLKVPKDPLTDPE